MAGENFNLDEDEVTNDQDQQQQIESPLGLLQDLNGDDSNDVRRTQFDPLDDEWETN